MILVSSPPVDDYPSQDRGGEGAQDREEVSEWAKEQSYVGQRRQML